MSLNQSVREKEEKVVERSETLRNIRRRVIKTIPEDEQELEWEYQTGKVSVWLRQNLDKKMS